LLQKDIPASTKIFGSFDSF